MKCRVCGNEHGNRPYTTLEMMFGFRDEFEYFQCSKCGCLQISEYPNDVEKYYGNSYYSYQDASYKNSIKIYLLKQRDRYEISHKGIMGRLLSLKSPNKSLRMFSEVLDNNNKAILDVGCGWGRFLRNLHSIGFNNLTGVDPFIENDLTIDDGFKIYKKKLNDLSGNYDVIFFHHSLEHMPHQANVFKGISKLLSKNGVCVIRIPVSSSYAWEHYGVNWVQLDAPRHYYLHSISSLGVLAENAGLKVSQIKYDSTAFQFWGSEQYVKNIPLRDKRSLAEGGTIFSKSQLTEYEQKANDLNLSDRGDQAVFFLTHAHV